MTLALNTIILSNFLLCSDLQGQINPSWHDGGLCFVGNQSVSSGTCSAAGSQTITAMRSCPFCLLSAKTDIQWQNGDCAIHPPAPSQSEDGSQNGSSFPHETTDSIPDPFFTTNLGFLLGGFVETLVSSRCTDGPARHAEECIGIFQSTVLEACGFRLKSCLKESSNTYVLYVLVRSDYPSKWGLNGSASQD
jgi:hypothetical protein